MSQSNLPSGKKERLKEMLNMQFEVEELKADIADINNQLYKKVLKYKKDYELSLGYELNPGDELDKLEKQK